MEKDLTVEVVICWDERQEGRNKLSDAVVKTDQKAMIHFLEAKREMQLHLYIEHWRKNTVHYQFIVLPKYTEVNRVQ